MVDKYYLLSNRFRKSFDSKYENISIQFQKKITFELYLIIIIIFICCGGEGGVCGWLLATVRARRGG